MTKFILRWAINAVALYAAVAIVPGIQSQSDNWFSFLILALIFGAINALLRPLLTLLTCPLIILTLGLGTLLINTLMFYLAGWAGRWFGAGLTFNSFWSVFFGSIVVSLVSIVLSFLLRDELKKKKRR